MPFLTKIGSALKGAAVKRAKAKALETAANTVTDEEKRSNLFLFVGLGGIGCLIFPILIIIVVFSYLLGIVQIADGAELSNGNISVAVGEAANIEGVQERIKWLYDNNGVPQTEEVNQSYLETFEVNYLDSNGDLKTKSLTMHKKLKNEVQAIFQDMVHINFKLEWDSGGGSIRGWNADMGYDEPFIRSAHCYGHAVDINVKANPMPSMGVGDKYEPGVNPYSVTEEVVNIWKQHGFYWGGDWSGQEDYMHFSYFNH